ncbi:MAG: hypothetical protein QXD13_02080 [Candidatus Pacearchaeota archaeon]
MDDNLIYHDIEGFVNYLSKALSDNDRCVVFYKLGKYPDAEGTDYLFEASCISLKISCKTGNRISHDDKHSDDRIYFESLLEEMINKKNLSSRVTLKRISFNG